MSEPLRRRGQAPRQADRFFGQEFRCLGGGDGTSIAFDMYMMRIHRMALGLVFGLAIAASALSIGARTVLAQSQACGLLTVEEVQALAPNQNVSGPGVSTNQGWGSVTCRYMWGTGNQHFTLALSVQPASRMFAGMSADSIKQFLAKTVRPETSDESIPDVGEAAIFTSSSSVYASASAYVKDRVLQVTLDGIDARDRKAQLIALLKSAAARL
jgi:hypothetical protein